MRFITPATAVKCNPPISLLCRLQTNTNGTPTLMLKILVSSLAVLAFASAPSLSVAAAQSSIVSTNTADVSNAHQVWTRILSKYVQPADDGVNRFDYGGLRDNAADSAALDAYIESYATLDMTTLSKPAQYVAWVNLYNAATVQYIRDRYPTRSIRSGYVVGPWKWVSYDVGGKKISLDKIENGVLRVQWRDPRTHYAINCASFGCPNLKPSAWETATLEQDLDAAARAYINHPRGVTIRKDGRLRVSTIYKWFRKDFGGSEAGVIAHLRDFAEPELLAHIDARPDIKNYEYDWSLNDTQ